VGEIAVVVAVGGNQITVEVGVAVIVGVGIEIGVAGVMGRQALKISNPKFRKRNFFIRN
jgi:hypothetical protein